MQEKLVFNCYFNKNSTGIYEGNYKDFWNMQENCTFFRKKDIFQTQNLGYSKIFCNFATKSQM